MRVSVVYIGWVHWPAWVVWMALTCRLAIPMIAVSLPMCLFLTASIRLFWNWAVLVRALGLLTSLSMHGEVSRMLLIMSLFPLVLI